VHTHTHTHDDNLPLWRGKHTLLTLLLSQTCAPRNTQHHQNSKLGICATCHLVWVGEGWSEWHLLTYHATSDGDLALLSPPGLQTRVFVWSFICESSLVLHEGVGVHVEECNLEEVRKEEWFLLPGSGQPAATGKTKPKNGRKKTSQEKTRVLFLWFFVCFCPHLLRLEERGQLGWRGGDCMVGSDPWKSTGHPPHLSTCNVCELLTFKSLGLVKAPITY
jgi:hypothetical protein